MVSIKNFIECVDQLLEITHFDYMFFHMHSVANKDDTWVDIGGSTINFSAFPPN